MTLIERINKFINAVASDIKSLYANKVNKTDVIAIAQGGTGAATATQARKNIGTIEYVASLPAIPEANKFYAVKNGNNIDLYMSDSAGTLFYKFTTSQQTINGLPIGDIITQLFANNEQGFAFDFNDLSTMYQDAAGTIPVTGVGQPVGRVLDKSGRGNHASQSTSAKRPILQQNATTGAYYLAFDGVDDCLATGNVDFSGSSKLSLFTGLRRNNDNTAIVVELSQTSGYSTPGAFYLVSGYDISTNGYTVAANNSSVAQITNVPALDIAVISLAFDKSTTTSKIRRNAVAGTNGNTDTGNFANFPVFIGARNQSSLRFNGHLYSLIGIARLATTTEITNTENAIAKTVGVTL